MSIRLPSTVRQFGDIIRKSGYEAFVVGGAVRNLLLGEKPADFDIATDATPAEIADVFRRVIPTGVQHGTVTVLFKNMQFEVTTYRTEGTYTDSRRPDTVQFVPSLIKDLQRRDFTINAIAVDARTGEIHDPLEGRADLKKGIIRAIGDPKERFSEDGLRLLRACRFSCQLNFTIEDETLLGMRESREKIRAVSAERVRDELSKILAAETPSNGFATMDDAGLLEEIIPELARCRDVLQKGEHAFDVLHHSLYSCDAAPRDNLPVRLAALLHDIGKPSAKAVLEDNSVIFHGHDKISSELARLILARLKYPKIVENAVVHLVRHHMFAYDSGWTDAAVRRFMKRIGTDYLDDLCSLRLADGFGMRRSPVSGLGIKELRKRIAEVFEKDQAVSIADLKVNGNDLAAKATIPKGPDMGLVLNFLLETVIDDPSQNEHAKLIELAKNFYQTYIASK